MSAQVILEQAVNDVLGNKALSDTPTCYFLGVHKGGSTMLASFIDIISKKSNLKALSPPQLLHNSGIPFGDWKNQESLKAYFHQSFIYYGFRSIPNFMLDDKNGFSQYPTVCLIRNPLDCVVSAYYSFRLSHRLPSNINSKAAQDIIRNRKKFENVNIDDYCLDRCKDFIRELSAVKLFAHAKMKIFKYEDIIFNKAPFFKEALAHTGISIDPEVFENAIKFVDVFPESENIHAHIRQVKPGDFKNKLTKKTINSLIEQNKEILKSFNYIA